MKDEIKEILEEVIEKNELYEECKEDGVIENKYYKSHLLLDYITKINKEILNLKRKIKQYEDPEDLTLFYMWLDEKAKDKMKQLQEEKEKYKHKFWEEQEQNEYLQDRIKELEQINEEHRKINGELRERINKAIKYLDSLASGEVFSLGRENEVFKGLEKYEVARNEVVKTMLKTETLLNILQGSDK